MRIVCTGSIAMKRLLPDLDLRDPKDMDFFTDDVEAAKKEIFSHDNQSGLKIEVLYCPIICDLHPEGDNVYNNAIVTLNELITVKASHIFFHPEQYQKTMYDIQLLKNNGAVIDVPLFYKLYDFWKEYLPSVRRSNLNMSAEDFFNNALKTEVDHDFLHELLIQHPVFEGQTAPTYTKILKDGAEVEVDEDKFNLLFPMEKYCLVLEEVMAMAYERFQGMNYRQAFKLMLDKFVMSHAPIWEALYIINNYERFNKPPFDFLEFLKEQTKQIVNNKNSNMDTNFIDVINTALSDISSLRYSGSSGKFKRLSQTNDGVIQDTHYGSQGDHNTIEEVYDIGLGDFCLKLTLHSDSYGNDEFVIGIKIVKPVKKEVIVYE